MEGSQVEVYLNTPLLKFKYKVGSEERELLEGAVRLSGKIVKQSDAGVVIDVKVISNMKATCKELPFETIFIPMNKIDFIVLK